MLEYLLKSTYNEKQQLKTEYEIQTFILESIPQFSRVFRDFK